MKGVRRPVLTSITDNIFLKAKHVPGKTFTFSIAGRLQSGSSLESKTKGDPGEIVENLSTVCLHLLSSACQSRQIMLIGTLGNWS